MIIGERRVSIDPELGPVRYCARCTEWWPDDEEFWWRPTNRRAGTTAISRGLPYLRHVDAVICRACQYEQTGRWRRERLSEPERREHRLAQMRESSARYRARQRERAS